MAERTGLPSVAEVQQLPLLREVQVPPEYEDFNGHMRITHHLGLHDDAGLDFFGLFGLDETYFSKRRNGIVDLEAHLRYLAEVHVGDVVAVHPRVLARSDKLVHTIWFLLNLSRDQIANTLEGVSLHIDLDQRRASPFPDDLAAALDGVIGEHEALAWRPPLCGLIGVR